MASDGRIFAPQIAGLSADHSLHIPAITAHDRIEALASDVITHAPQRFALMGQGLGGSIALEVLRKAPERVTRVMLISTDPLSDTPQAAAERDPLIARARAGRLEDVVAAIFPTEALAPSAHRIAISRELHELALDLGVEVFVRQQRALQRRRDHQGTLRRVKVPTAVVAGQHDSLCPLKRQKFMADLMPHAQFFDLPDAGHWPGLEAPETVNKLIKTWMKAPLMLRPSG